MKVVSATILRLTTLGTAMAGILLLGNTPASAQTLFYDDFSGPTLNSAWRAYLPSVPILAPPATTYVGAPASYSFQTLAGASVLRLTETLPSYRRAGWSTTDAFNASGFRYEARFNTLNQSASTSIDAFFELWIFDPANPSRYDKVDPFGGSFSSERQFFASSSIDNSATQLTYNYQNNTWYRLVVQCAPGQNIRVSLNNDSGTELIGKTFNHGADAYTSGFDLAISQAMGAPYTGSGPCDVAVDWVQLTQVPEPTSATLLVGALAGALLWTSGQRGKPKASR